MPVAAVIEGARRVLKTGLPAVVGVLAVIIAFAVAGLLDLVPEALKPAHSWIVSIVVGVEGPVKFLVSLLAAAFAFLKFLKKDDALTETCRTAAAILFEGYAANFLMPLRKIALAEKRLIVIAMPTFSFFGDRDYIKEVSSELVRLGISVKAEGGKGAPTYTLLTEGRGKAAPGVIFDIPRTLVGANTVVDGIDQAGRGSRKTREKAYRRLAQAFFAALEEWRKTNRYDAVITTVIPGEEDDSAALAAKIAATLRGQQKDCRPLILKG